MKRLEGILKKEASAGIRKSGISRYELAAKMSEMLGYEISKTMLDNRTAKLKKDQHWPASWIAPFALITGHLGQLRVLNKLARFPAAGSGEFLDMEIARKRRVIEKEQKDLDELAKFKTFINANGARKS